MAGRLHLEKKGLRGLAIAESFGHDSPTSILSGVVMRRDFVIDGAVFGRTTLGGDDATDVILSMFERLERNDVSYLLLSGLVISLYNIVDIQRLHDVLRIPVIGITYNNSGGLEPVLRDRFPSSDSKLTSYGRLGPREMIPLHTSGSLFVRRAGCSITDAACLLNGLTLQGSVPEPVRVSKMLSNTLLSWLAL